MDALTGATWTGRMAAALLAVALLASGLAACEDASTPDGPDDAGATAGTGGGTGEGGTGGTGGTGGMVGTDLDNLVAVLRTGTRTERAEAATELGELGDDTAVPALVDALGDESWEVRGAAAEALGALPDPTAVAPLLDLIAKDPAEPEVREEELWAAIGAYDAAMRALGIIGDPDATRRLAEIAVDQDSDLDRDAAAQAVLAIGEAAVPELERAIDKASAAKAVLLVGLLARLGAPARDPLVAALKDHRSGVRVAAADALGSFGTSAVKPLIAVLGGKETALRTAAARSLGEIGSTRANPALVKMLSNAKVRRAAVLALVAINRDNATPLVKYLKSRSTVQVYRPLIRIGQSNTVSALVTALKKYGTETMGEGYLNCGQPRLEKAAKQWARAHGYIVVPGFGTSEDGWGER